MALNKQRDICRRCEQGPKWIKARGLCESCYMAVRANGTREDWPRLDEKHRRKRYSGMCQCYSPIPQPIPGWMGAMQCLKCGKKLPDAR